jgi:hypothetical protein
MCGTGKYGKSGADRPVAGAATGSDDSSDCVDCTAGQLQVRTFFHLRS